MLRRPQAGFTLVETLIGAGIAAATGLVMFKVMDESNRGLRQVESREDMNQLHRELITRFSDRVVCTQSFIEGIARDVPEFDITRVVNENYNPLMTIPLTQGKVTLKQLTVRKINKETKRAELLAKYTYGMKGKIQDIQKVFNVEMSYRDGRFTGCIARGSMVMDPQEACDLVVGSDPDGKSYFYDGLCNFGRASCEHSGRTWDESLKKCLFSEEDLEALRQEICRTLGFNYNPGTQQCLPTQAHMDMLKQMGVQGGGNAGQGQGNNP